MDPDDPDPRALAAPAAALAAGALVAFPTETVYGLGADAWNPAALARIYAVKGRPATDPLIVHVLDWPAARALVDPRADRPLLDLAARLAAAFWPGPLTLVLPRHPRLPLEVTGGGPSVALRAPAHPVARRLLALAGVPVAAPSANRFGGVSPTSADDVLADLGPGLDWLVDGGPCPLGLESTVLDLRGPRPRILRPGGVSREALAALLPQGLEGPGDEATQADGSAAEDGAGAIANAGDPVAGSDTDIGGASGIDDDNEGAPADPLAAPLPSPGLLSRHYAPRHARLSLFVGAPEAQRQAILAAALEARSAGRRVALLVPAEDQAPLRAALATEAAVPASPPLPATPAVTVATLGARADLAEAARLLYRRLRDLDAAGYEVILALDLGAAGLGLALRDRLSRAAEGRVIRL